MRRGFSLLELLVVVAVLGILLAITALGSRGYIEQLRFNEASATFKTTLERVRDEARNQSQPVVIQLSGSTLRWGTPSTGLAAGPVSVTLSGSAIDEELGRVTLPNGVEATGSPSSTVMLSGRGQPFNQTVYTVAKGKRNRTLTLLVTGKVLER